MDSSERPGPNPTAIDSAVHDALIDAFYPLATLKRRHPILTSIHSHIPDSIAGHDFARAPILGREPWHIAMDQIANALDHLLVWRQLFVLGKMYPPFAHITLIRGAMEAATTARWVLDASKPAETRIGRAAGWLVEDYGLRAKSERFMDPVDTSAGGMSAEGRIEQLRGRAKDEDIAIIPAWGHTDRFRGYGVPPGPKSERHYGVLSAFAHARRWRLLLSESVPIQEYEDGTSLRAVGANDIITVSLTNEAVRWLDFAIDDASLYAGLRTPLDVESFRVEPVPTADAGRASHDAVDDRPDDGPPLG